MRSLLFWPLVALLCVPLGARAAPQASGAEPAGPEGPRTQRERPTLEHPVLDRLPRDLPRSAPQRWDGLYAALDAGRQTEWFEQVDVERMQLAENCYKGRRYPECLVLLYGLLETYPDMPLALQLLGTTYFRLRRYGDARECFERFLAVAPEQLWRTQGLGHCYYTLGEYGLAAAHYERVLAGLPDSQEALRGLALSLGRLGEEERALELLERVLAIEPEHSEALCARAQIHLDRGDGAAALADAERAHESAPWEPRPLYLKLRALRLEGQDEAADRLTPRWRELDAWAQSARALEDSISYGRDVYRSAQQLAQIYTRTRNFEGLRRTLDVAVAQAPASVSRLELYIFCLDAFQNAGDLEGAASAAQALERDFAEEAEAWKALQRYYAVRRDRKREIEAGEKALRLGAR